MKRSSEEINKLLDWFEKFSDELYYKKNIAHLRNLIGANLGKDLLINNECQRYRQNMYIIYDEKEQVIIDLSLSLREIQFMTFKPPFVTFLYFYKNYQFRYLTKKSKKANKLAGWKKVHFFNYAKEEPTSQNNL